MTFGKINITAGRSSRFVFSRSSVSETEQQNGENSTRLTCLVINPLNSQERSMGQDLFFLTLITAFDLLLILWQLLNNNLNG